MPLPTRRALLLAALVPAAARGADRCSSGRRQSPIDIVPTARRALPLLRIDWPRAPLRIVHDGHTVRVRAASGSRTWMGAVPHVLQQVHLHLPAGDLLRGESFPLGLHFPHKSPSGQLVTLVRLMREGAPHPALAALLPLMPVAGAPEQRDARVVVDIAAWLPRDLGYYRYDGSLTGPPCTEGVVWVVLKDVGSASAAQLQALRARIAPNARPVQPRHDRVVLESA
ncbi:MAG: carbonic anhydrase family protein [Rubrivivax sp.]